MANPAYSVAVRQMNLLRLEDALKSARDAGVVEAHIDVLDGTCTPGAARVRTASPGT